MASVERLGSGFSGEARKWRQWREVLNGGCVIKKLVLF